MEGESRNRELMRVFRDVELVEQLGSGMRRMLGAYSPDIFRYTETFFHVVLRYPDAPLAAGGGGKPGHPQTDGGPKDKGGPNHDGGPKSKAGPKVGKVRAPSVGAVELRIRIYEFIAAHPDATTRGLAAHFGHARSAILKHLAHLKDAGVVRHVGAARNGHWEVCQREGGRPDLCGSNPEKG